MRNDEGVYRYVIIHVEEDGLRVMTFPMHGRNTYSNKLNAYYALWDFRVGLRDRVLGEEMANTLAIRQVECWPEHFDPKRCIFDE